MKPRKPYPITYSPAMMLALLGGLKTKTRRLWKPKGVLGGAKFHGEPAAVHEHEPWPGEVKKWTVDLQNAHGIFAANATCPYGQTGDLLWVRENFRLPKSLDAMNCTEVAARAADAGYTGPWAPVRYEADGATINAEGVVKSPAGAWGGEWGRLRVARFMPRWLSRLTQRLTSVGLEHVQAVTDAEALAEGVRPFTKDGNLLKYAPALYRRVSVPGSDEQVGELDSDWAWVDMKPTARDAFLHLFYNINGRADPSANPLVWVLGFATHRVNVNEYERAHA